MANGKGKKNKSRNGKKSRKGNGNGTHSAFNTENVADCGDIVKIPAGWQGPAVTNQIYRIRRISDAADANQSAGSVGTFNTQFLLSAVDSVTDFTDLFDMYRIALIRMKFRPRFNFSAISSTATNVNPRLYTAIDYNEPNGAITLAVVRQYTTCKETRFDKDHSRMFRPRPLLDSGTTPSGSVTLVENPWIETSSPNTKYYGLIGVIEAGLVGQTLLQSWAIEIEYFLEFKMVQ